MSVSSKITFTSLQQAVVYSGVVIVAAIVVAANIINGIGRQFSQEDSYLRQSDDYLTGKILSCGESLKEYAISFFVQKKVEAVSVKLIENNLKKEAPFVVDDTFEKIQKQTYERALSDIGKYQPQQSAKEDMAKAISIEAKKIARKILNQEKTGRFRGWSDMEFKEQILRPAADRHVDSYMRVFQIALEEGVSCAEAKAIADGRPDEDDVHAIIAGTRVQKGSGNDILSLKEILEKDHGLTNKNNFQDRSPTNSVLTRVLSWESRVEGASPGSVKTD